MKEYADERGSVDITKLEAGFMDSATYAKAHAGLVMVCHDAFIEYDGGILLVTRIGLPGKDLLWPIGGRVLRGVPILDSLRKKVKDECGLTISNIVEIGISRTYSHTDPFNHGKGTDTINIAYFCQGKGSIKLDLLHTKQTILTTAVYNSIKNELHPYVRDFVVAALALIKK